MCFCDFIDENNKSIKYLVENDFNQIVQCFSMTKGEKRQNSCV